MDVANMVKQSILNEYEDMTQVEKSIADFFSSNMKMLNFSSKNISKLLYVSEATLSRFAKKCSYKGYREFIYAYEKELEDELKEKNFSVLTRRVKNTYYMLLEESFKLLDEEKVKKTAALMHKHKKVLIYGMGNSGYAAKEFQLRFMRLGLSVEAITDSQMIQMSAALVTEECLVIAITLSGKTREVVKAIKSAKAGGASVILITANKKEELKQNCDEVLYAAATKNLDGGTMISPQFPILILVDVFYTYYFANDTKNKSKKYLDTLSALLEERNLDYGDK